MKPRFLILALAMFVFGCEKMTPLFECLNQQIQGSTQKPDLRMPTTVPMKIELSVDSVLDHALKKDKAGVENAHLKGQKHVVGLLDGKEWLSMSPVEQYHYVRAVADFHSFIGRVMTAALDDLDRERGAKKLEHTFGNMPSYRADLMIVDKIDDRLGAVIPGRTFADLADAITKYYTNSPLLKDRAVLWVLSVPLNKELKATRPKPVKGSTQELFQPEDEIVSVYLEKLQ